MTVVWVLAGAAVAVLGLAIWVGRRLLDAPTEVLPSPDDGHPRWSLDLQRSGVRLPRPR